MRCVQPYIYWESTQGIPDSEIETPRERRGLGLLLYLIKYVKKHLHQYAYKLVCL